MKNIIIAFLLAVFLTSCSNDNEQYSSATIYPLYCQTYNLGITETHKNANYENSTENEITNWSFCEEDNYITVKCEFQEENFMKTREFHILKTATGCLNSILFRESYYDIEYTQQVFFVTYNLDIKIQEYIPNEFLKIEFSYRYSQTSDYITKKAWIEFKSENEQCD